MRKTLLFYTLFLFTIPVIAQTEISGKVMDKKTKKPLAFVNIVYGDPPRGTSTNIDGKFKLNLSFIPEKLEFSYLGYNTKVVRDQEINPEEELSVYLEQKSFGLDQVVIKPGHNPANDIIRKVYENKDKNNPTNLHSFSYRSYNKMIFTLDTTEYVKKETYLQDTSGVDSSEIRLRNFMDKQHLMLMESISNREFLNPDKNKETVTASRVSGFKDPSLAFLATQFQSFSFYDDFIKIGDYNYLNPIIKNSPQKYLFQIEDTLFTNKLDSIFVISFRPRKGKNFDALKGFLHINTKGYALQKVIAEPSKPQEQFNVKIQQQYELIEGRQWFPSQLNTRIKFNNILAETDHNKYFIIGDGRTYIRDIKINPKINPKIFDRVKLEVPDKAYKKSDEYWQNNRMSALTKRDLRTYEVIDSIGQEHHFDRRLKTFQVIMTGYYPYKFINIDYRKVLSYNRYEGLRLGLGAMTNDKVSPWFAVGGYFAYGFKDKDFKYGGEFQFNIHEESEMKLNLSYSDDVSETGGYSFLMDHDLTSTENYRKYLVQSMDQVEKKEVDLTFRALQYLKVNLFLNQYQVNPLSPYQYTFNNKSYTGNFHFSETGMRLKFAYKEEFIETPWGKISEGTNYPVLYANVTKGNQWLGGEFDNLRFEGRVSKTFVTKNFGKTHINVMGGMATGELPVFNLYNGNGSYGSDFSLQIDNTFATMQVNEFFAQQFVSLFFRQNFGSLLFKTKNFSPRFSLVTNMGWGWMENMNSHTGLTLTSFDKGYYESGLLLDNLFSVNFFSYGLGVYYRYGPYSYSKTADNFAYKLSFRFSF